MRTLLSSAMLAAALTVSVPGLTEMPYHGEGHIIVGAEELEWGDVASMDAGARITVLEGRLNQSEPFTFRLKLPADFRIAPHIHPAYERVTVLRGTLHFAHGREFDRDATTAMTAGDFAVMPPGAPMYGYTEEETVIQLHGTGPWDIEYLDPKDDPRKRQARLAE